MPFTKFTNLDFDQIKTSIKDYLRANSTFTDFDFEGSNFSVLIDTLAYNTYITAFNSNMVVNESFLDSATVRENVVSLARNIGYVPYSKNAAEASVSFTITVPPSSYLQDNTPVYTPTITLQAGLVCTGSVKGTSYIFSTPENITVPVVNGVATFSNINIKEGTFLSKKFTVNASLDQRFILDNPSIDTSTIRVYVKGSSDSGLGIKYSLVDNIFKVDSNSKIFLIQEVQDEKYQILFGDGFFGQKLENNAIITVNYIVTSGREGNGVRSFSFGGSLRDANGLNVIPQSTNTVTITTNRASQNGSDVESIDSIRYFAPRLYASQYRAVTANDYETIIKSKIYGNAESISVIGGEELSPPQFGTVLISIKPKNGTFVSDFDKQNILDKLKQYSVSGINAKIIDLKILYVEIESYIYYNDSLVASSSDLKTRVNTSLTKYSESVDLNKFGGRFKYSKLLHVIDNTDTAITSNITKVRIRRNLKALINRQAQYEICFGNQFHVNESGYNIKSTGFNIIGDPDTVYFTDTPNADKKTGVISIVKPIKSEVESNSSPNIIVVSRSVGTVNYEIGEIILNTITITSTSLENDIIEIQAYPESNDVVGLKDLYVSFDISKSEINMVKDTIASGEDISGVVFTKNSYRSSYSNGSLTRS